MTTLDLSSIGYLCGNVQQTPNAIRKATKQLGIEPAARINGIPHYDSDQAERITAYFREQQSH